MKMTRKTALAINRGRRAKGMKAIRFGVLKRSAPKRKPTTRKAAKRKPAKRRAAAPRKRSTSRSAPARKRSTRRRPRENVVVSGLKAAAPVVVGAVLAKMAAARFGGSTTRRRAVVVTGVAAALTLFAKKIARVVPVKPATINLVAAGVFTDAAFRISAPLRARVPGLPAAAARPGGLIAGGRRSSPNGFALDMAHAVNQ